ncbi:uncharacterized protein K452DRAFT_156920 [Aplosporella prunicola CBS 121167]|uniref:AMP-activated protein kinase glycogen-binding domain-containing protein n=1 Tax=Aplosporella prunicola CBS 121167 TaxID=1176127 RepID=A0A6A6BNB9_9PEZI|nr:uncharacterized protein K452DRAFT_156920 [Aplosporella prunicola CBS 121167]KAF2144327.1 hypothetical protein K452DRAFT_156920 [Aplosporella prunicola CBS 121167]
MPSIRASAKGLVHGLKPVASEADLLSKAATTRRPQTIITSSKSSFKLHRPSHYLRKERSAADMDLSRPKLPVTITYSHPDTQPPVYLACSVTNPPWEPMEMAVKEERSSQGDLIFEKTLDAVEPGEYQYKFRLGPGDWWVMDETAPKISDGAGNSNNLLTVKEPTDEAIENKKLAMHRTTSAPDFVADAKPTNGEQPNGNSMEPNPAMPSPVLYNLSRTAFDPEQPSDGAPAQASGEDPAMRKSDTNADAEASMTEARAADTEAEHEGRLDVPTLTVEKSDGKPKPVILDEQEEQPAMASMYPDFARVLGDDALGFGQTPADEKVPLLPHESFSAMLEDTDVPLFRHESIAADESSSEDAVDETEFVPISYEGGAPLFRHETSPMIGGADSPPRSPIARSSRSHTSLKDMMDEEDVNDPSLVPFPTRRETIFEHIRSLENRMEEDKSIPDESPPSPTQNEAPSPQMSRNSSAVDLRSSSLDSIQEGEEDEDDLASSASAAEGEQVVTAGPTESATPVPGSRSVPTPPLTPQGGKGEGKTTRSDSLVMPNERRFT